MWGGEQERVASANTGCFAFLLRAACALRQGLLPPRVASLVEVAGSSRQQPWGCLSTPLGALGQPAERRVPLCAPHAVLDLVLSAHCDASLWDGSCPHPEDSPWELSSCRGPGILVSFFFSPAAHLARGPAPDGLPQLGPPSVAGVFSLLLHQPGSPCRPG